ncbi:MAG: hypothetical protein VW405_06570, partial [Rhodospirillaceae bacterium]
QGGFVRKWDLAAANGVDLYGPALKRLFERTLAGLDDPAYLAEKTGAAQTWVGALGGAKLTWMEPWHARFGDPRRAPWLTHFRPLRNARTGGDATALWGVPVP